jgi:hypothetical protein
MPLNFCHTKCAICGEEYKKRKKKEYKNNIPVFLCYLPVVRAALRHLFMIA